MTYVMSDIHGNSRRFNSIMKQINLKEDDTLYILGDVIDRYPDGIRILRKIMKMPNVKMLLGNHEYMMLKALSDNSNGQSYQNSMMHLWHRNGGRVTHNYIKHIRKTLRKEIFDYLKSLPINIDINVNNKNYKLVHGYPSEYFNKLYGYYKTEEEFAVWKRWAFYEDHSDRYILVFGHTPTIHYSSIRPLQIYYHKEHGDEITDIGIDCGAGFDEDIDSFKFDFGRLACLRLDDMKEFYSEENYNID